MVKTVIITCFGYPKNNKYVFDPIYIRSDLKKVISFALSKVKCKLQNIIVITDLDPNKKIVQEINEEIKLSSKRMKPKFRSNNILEFISIFTCFHKLDSAKEYYNLLQDLFHKINPGDELFFYFTGHGIRFVEEDKIKGFAIVVQGENGTGEYISSEKMQHLINLLPNNIKGLIVLDCCNSSELISLGYEYHPNGNITFPSRSQSKDHKLVFLASCKSDQTCGFYENEIENKYGSLFTHYLLPHIKKPKFSFMKIFTQVGKLVLDYRQNNGKPPQNITIQMSSPDLREIPEFSST